VGLPAAGVAARSGPDYRVWPFHFLKVTHHHHFACTCMLHACSIFGLRHSRMLKAKTISAYQKVEGGWSAFAMSRMDFVSAATLIAMGDSGLCHKKANVHATFISASLLPKKKTPTGVIVFCLVCATGTHVEICQSIVVDPNSRYLNFLVRGIPGCTKRYR
jgi:hypothetical protein